MLSGFCESVTRTLVGHGLGTEYTAAVSMPQRLHLGSDEPCLGGEVPVLLYLTLQPSRSISRVLDALAEPLPPPIPEPHYNL
jgi:hypothetical protein